AALDDAVGARVVVVVVRAGLAYDRRQPVDAGHRRCGGQSAVIVLADHAGLAVEPGGRRDEVAVLVVRGAPALEPVDDLDRGVVVGRVLRRRAAGRAAGGWRC